MEELRHDELTAAERARVAEISERWLGRKKGFGGELQMMTHPFYMEDEVCGCGCGGEMYGWMFVSEKKRMDGTD